MGQAKRRAKEIEELKVNASTKVKSPKQELHEDSILYARIMAGSTRAIISPRQSENAFINECKKINNCSVEVATKRLERVDAQSFEKLANYIMNYLNHPIKKLLITEPIDEVILKVQSSNNTTYQPHFKSAHSVNGHWRNQPYGPRNNPKYKKIWIEEFDKGIA